MGFDAVSGVLLAISGLTSLARGGLRELMSFSCFLGAGIVCLLASNWIFNVLSGGAAFFAMALCFLAAYYAFAASHSAALGLQGLQGRIETIGAFDRFVGLILGLGRGLFLLVLYVRIIAAIAVDLPGEWGNGSLIYPYVVATNSALNPLFARPSDPESNSAGGTRR